MSILQRNGHVDIVQYEYGSKRLGFAVLLIKDCDVV